MRLSMLNVDTFATGSPTRWSGSLNTATSPGLRSIGAWTSPHNPRLGSSSLCSGTTPLIPITVRPKANFLKYVVLSIIPAVENATKSLKGGRRGPDGLLVLAVGWQRLLLLLLEWMLRCSIGCVLGSGRFASSSGHRFGCGARICLTAKNNDFDGANMIEFASLKLHSRGGTLYDYHWQVRPSLLDTLFRLEPTGVQLFKSPLLAKPCPIIRLLFLLADSEINLACTAIESFRG